MIGHSRLDSEEESGQLEMLDGWMVWVNQLGAGGGRGVEGGRVMKSQLGAGGGRPNPIQYEAGGVSNLIPAQLGAGGGRPSPIQ